MNKLIVNQLPMRDLIKPEIRQGPGVRVTSSILENIRRMTPKRGGDGPDGYEIEYNDGTMIMLVFQKSGRLPRRCPRSTIDVCF